MSRDGQQPQCPVCCLRLCHCYSWSQWRHPYQGKISKDVPRQHRYTPIHYPKVQLWLFVNITSLPRIECNPSSTDFIVFQCQSSMSHCDENCMSTLSIETQYNIFSAGFPTDQRNGDKEFVIRRAATNRVLNVLRHWVSKHSPVKHHNTVHGTFIVPVHNCSMILFTYSYTD